MTWHVVDYPDDDPFWDDVVVTEEMQRLADAIAAGPRLGKDDDPGRPPFPPLPKDGEIVATFVAKKSRS